MKRRLLLPFVLVLFSLIRTFGQTPNYQLLIDQQRTPYFGSENILSIHHFLYKSQDQYIPNQLWTEDNFLRKGGGIFYRFTKLALLDFQIDYLAILAQHEVFGHGARYREFGYTDISYKLSLPFPFGTGSGFARGSRPSIFERIVTPHESIISVAGGNEANSVLANTLESRMILGGKIHYREALLYFLSRNNQLGYIWLDHFVNPQGHGDINSYVFQVNNIHIGASDYYDTETLVKQSLISALNPMQVYALFALAKTYLFDGNETLETLPMIRIKEIKYLPALGYNLTPFGTEFLTSQYIVHGHKMAHLKFGIGDARFNSFYSFGLELHNILETERINLNVHVNGWHQPSLNLGGEVTTTTAGGLGFHTKVDLSVFPLANQNIGLFAQLGYKTPGYLIGERLSGGLIGRFGLSIKL